MATKNNRHVSTDTPEWTIYRLQDVLAFVDLPKIERAKGVRFTVVGKLPYRIAQLNQAGSAILRDSPSALFDLMRTEGSLKLLHSGPPSLTAAIRNDVLASVPLSELLRWKIKSEAEIDPLSTGLYSIPVQRMSLTTDSYGWRDPEDGFTDVSSGIYRFQFRSNLEINDGLCLTKNLLLGILDYLQIIVSEEKFRFLGSDSLSDGFLEAIRYSAANATPEIFLADEIFQWRFYSRLSRLLDSSFDDAHLIEGTLEELGFSIYRRKGSIPLIRKTLNDFQDYNPNFRTAPVSTNTSKSLVKRIEGECAQNDWLFGEAAEQKFSQIFSEISDKHSTPITMPGQQVVLVLSPLMQINQGHNTLDENNGATPEFVHFTIYIKNPFRFDFAYNFEGEDLAVLPILYSDEGTPEPLFLPSAVTVVEARVGVSTLVCTVNFLSIFAEDVNFQEVRFAIMGLWQ